MSTSSIASSLSLADLYAPHQCRPYTPVIRGDSPVLGFDADSDDPLHFPSPDFPRDLCDSKRDPLPLPAAVIPALHSRASALSLRKSASALSLRRIPTTSSLYRDSARNAVYLDVDDVGALLQHAPSTLFRTPSFDSTLELDEDADEDEAAYYHSLYESPYSTTRPPSQVYLGSPYAPSSPLQYHSSNPSTSSTTSPARTPLTPLSPPAALLPPPPQVGSRWSLTSSLDALPPSPNQTQAQTQTSKKEKKAKKGAGGLGKKSSSRDLGEREKSEKAPAPNTRQRLTSFISRLSLGASGLLSPAASTTSFTFTNSNATSNSAGSSSASLAPLSPEREMQKAYLERDDPPVILKGLGSPRAAHGKDASQFESMPAERDRDTDRWQIHDHTRHTSSSAASDLDAPPLPPKDRTRTRTRPALFISTSRVASPSQSLPSPGYLLHGTPAGAAATPTPPTPTPASPGQSSSSYHSYSNSFSTSSYVEYESTPTTPETPNSLMAFTCAPPSPSSSLDNLPLDIELGTRRERQRRQLERGRLVRAQSSVNLTASSGLFELGPAFVEDTAKRTATFKAAKKDKERERAETEKEERRKREKELRKQTAAKKQGKTASDAQDADTDSVLSLGLGVLSSAPSYPYLASPPTSPSTASFTYSSRTNTPGSPTTFPAYTFPSSSSSTPSSPMQPRSTVRPRRSTGLLSGVSAGLRGLRMRLASGSTPASASPAAVAPPVPKKDCYGAAEYPPRSPRPRQPDTTPAGERLFSRPSSVEELDTGLAYAHSQSGIIPAASTKSPAREEGGKESEPDVQPEFVARPGDETSSCPAVSAGQRGLLTPAPASDNTTSRCHHGPPPTARAIITSA
ncbi:hypothetical protein LshimejAT787_0603810 [Lyophyllum shimeji]|uniref:Uncharacterized protein n=1 Tax=Lyophyllum shimeji TaxID=47721 RepID=A0A9P3ULG1_LYOSH|nr:hypothetical protein LshimejAT787_0603810 [Lyophyllum shimeji]